MGYFLIFFFYFFFDYHIAFELSLTNTKFVSGKFLLILVFNLLMLLKLSNLDNKFTVVPSESCEIEINSLCENGLKLDQ